MHSVRQAVEVAAATAVMVSTAAWVHEAAAETLQRQSCRHRFMVAGANEKRVAAAAGTADPLHLLMIFVGERIIQRQLNQCLLQNSCRWLAYKHVSKR
jgi:hypothetical protein